MPSPSLSSSSSSFLALRKQQLREQAAVDLPLLRSNWPLLLFCLVFQWVHSVATNLVYYLHEQREPLKDMGYHLIPRLSKDHQGTPRSRPSPFPFSLLCAR